MSKEWKWVEEDIKILGFRRNDVELTFYIFYIFF